MSRRASRATAWFGLALAMALGPIACGTILGLQEKDYVEAGPDGSMAPVSTDDASINANGDTGISGDDGGPLVPDDGGPLEASADAAAPLGLGTACTQDSQCGLGHCADGVCCDQACTGSCEQCNLGSLAGTCSPVLAGVVGPASHTACAESDAGTCGSDGKCDGKRGCELWANGTSCGTGACDATANQAVLGSSCDGNGHCNSSNPVTCAPFKCTPGGSTCAKACSTASDCVGQPCVNGSCGTVANGSPCTAGTQCTSTFCIDGFCCDKACSGSCQACDVSGVPGVCTTVPSGQPHGSRAACAGTSVCKGSCTGSSTACAFPAVTCAAQTCSGGTESLASSCNGAGACSTQAQTSCNGFACNTTTASCYTSCTGDGQCGASTPFCNTATKTCQSTAPAGHACSAGGQCGTGNCVDSVCCSSASCSANDQCHMPGTCAAGTGVCTYAAVGDGTSCNDGNTCTLTDTCQGGVCTGSTPVTCTALDACHMAGSCTPGAGCSNPPATAGTSCIAPNASVAKCDGSGTCNETKCATGYLDCDGKPSNGCETPYSVANCGGCGTACAPKNVAAAVCSPASPSCGYTTCAPFTSGDGTYLDCNGNTADGCEVLPSDYSNCGMCGNNCNLGGHDCVYLIDGTASAWQCYD
jgi:hypothetical protein